MERHSAIQETTSSPDGQGKKGASPTMQMSEQ